MNDRGEQPRRKRSVRRNRSVVYDITANGKGAKPAFVAGSEMQQREKTSFAITPRVKLALENLKLRLARAGR